MYVTVCFDGKSTEEVQLLVNPNCSIRVILNYIKSEIVNSGISMGVDQDIDLCEKNGDPLKLTLAKPSLNAFEEKLLKPRAVYYPILYRRDEYGELYFPTPMSTKISEHFKDYMEKGRKASLQLLRKFSTKAVIKPTKLEKPERGRKGLQKN